MRLQRSTGLVGHWKFNEKSGIIANDSSRYKNTGTLIGATHLPVWAEKGIKFDGVDDYVNAGNDASLGFDGNIHSYTISFWVKATTVAANSRVISKAGAAQYPFRLTGSATNLQAVVYDGTVFPSINYGNVWDGTWKHIVLTVDRTNLTGYINGIGLTPTANTVANTTANSINVLIGIQYNYINPFNGSIDEVRIYNRALSAAEIKQYYDSTKHKYI